MCNLSAPQILRRLRSLPGALALFVAGLGLLLVGVPLMATITHAADESSVRAVIPPRATAVPAPDDSEITIDEIRTDKYPSIKTRFSLRPLSGLPPAYLEPHDINIISGLQFHPVLEVHTVGRVPTTGVGSYEVSWISYSPTSPGESLAARMAVSINGRPEVSTGLQFTVPFPPQADAPAQRELNHALIAVPAPTPGTINMSLASSLAAILGGTAFLATIAGLIWHARWRAAQDRLAMWVGRSAEHRARAIQKASKEGRKSLTISPMVAFFGKIGAKLVPSNQGDKLRRTLILAGRPGNQQYTRFVATKAGLAVALFMGGFWLMIGLAPFTTTLLTATTAAIVGFMLPSIWLGRAIKKRQYLMKKALPDALDLITIGVSAGLSFDGAIGEILEKWDNDLSFEFSTMLGELRMGAGRRQALLNLADRTQVDEIQIMTSQLIQADELGMSLTETLLTLANQMRLRRRQHAEELAHKAAVKMLIPLVFLIFPALFVVILGPAAQDLFSFFSNGPN
ncbi:MAG: type II secretion system F family protein [Chloroflexi bacterium]|nr:type II secretion system F family protein [Chloroflexota bacterium]